MDEAKLQATLQKYLWRDERSGQSLFVADTIGSFPSVCVQSWEERAGTVISTIICSATMPYLHEGIPIRMTGIFKQVQQNAKMVFAASRVEERTGAKEINLALLRSFGLTKKNAASVADQIGDEDLFLFCQKPDAVKILSASTDLSVEEIAKLLHQVRISKVEQKLFRVLHEFSITYTVCLKAVKKYGEQTMQKIQENPYRLMDCGAGFDQADALARFFGMSQDDRRRLSAITKNILQQGENSGDTWMDMDLFKKRLDWVLDGSTGKKRIPITECFPFLREAIQVRTQKSYGVERKELFDDEVSIKKNLHRLNRNKKRNMVPEELITYAEQKCQIHYGSQQREAFGTVLSGDGIKILTGGPGTGKTTTVKGIILAFQKLHPGAEIKLCAPTGRAAQRMAESTGFPATTIHRLLEYRPFESGEATHKDASDPIEADLVVCDEMSMADTHLFSMLLDAIKDDATVLLVGDPNQLEPVGPGNVLSDVMRIADMTRLTDVFRQKGGSPIIENAIRIQNNQTNMMTCEDFKVINVDTEETLRENALNLITSCYNADDPFETQILCPSRKGAAGIDSLNERAQAILNPKKGPEVHYGRTAYRIGDKILMIRNNVEMDYYNGDIGIVQDIRDGLLVVNIRNHPITLTRDLMGDIKLSYAMTIHKSQGSEFKNVVVVMPQNPPGMMVRNLFYTAITRAKKKIVVISQTHTMERAIHYVKHSRNTMLPLLLDNDVEVLN